MGEPHRGQPLSGAQSYIDENEALVSLNENDKIKKNIGTGKAKKCNRNGVTTKYNLYLKASDPLAQQSRGHSRVI